MKTYNTVAIETDINGVDSNEELIALFTRALELCQTTKATHRSSPSSTQYLSFDDVTYCVRNTESVDLNPIPLPDMDYSECLESVQAVFNKIKQENKYEVEEAVKNDNTEAVETGDDVVANGSHETSHPNKCVAKCSVQEEVKCSVCDEMCRSQEAFTNHIITHKEETSTIEEENVVDKSKNTVKHTNQRPFQKHLPQHSKETCIEASGGEDDETMKEAQMNVQNMEVDLNHEQSQTVLHDIVEQEEDTLQQEKVKRRKLKKKQIEKKPHICPYCNRDCRFFSILQVHLRTHTKEKPFKCQHCDKSFARALKLREHVMRHLGDKPHKCSVCDKAFVTKQELKEHLQTHTGQKLHQCQFCVKGFAKRNALVEHMRTHTGERPHVCNFCKKAYKRKQHLVEHLQVHRGQREHNCELCDKVFLQKRYLTQHLRTHSRECNLCGMVFITIRELIRHLKTHSS